MRMKNLIMMFTCVACSLGVRAEVCGDVDSLQVSRLHELLEQAQDFDKQYDTYHALMCYEAALQLDSTFDIVRKVAQCQYQRGQFYDCIHTMEKLDDDSINHQDMKLRYNCYFNLNMKDLALQWGKRMADEFPYDAEAVVNIANHYNTIEQPDSALLYTQNYKRKDSTNVFVNRQQAFAYYRKGEYTKALDEYSELLSLKDYTASAYFYLGLCYAKCDSLELAYDNLMEAARLYNFDNPHVLYQLGSVCIDMGMAEDGIGYIEKAISLLQPDDNLMFTFTNALANGYFKRHKYEACAQALTKCLEYDGSSVYTLYRLGQTYGLLKNSSLEYQYYRSFIREAEGKDDQQASMGNLIRNAQRRVREIMWEELIEEAIDP